MKHVGDMKLYSFEELLDEDYGKVGTPERDKFERSVDEAVHAYRVGEAIKKAREAQQLTQAELGEKMGVQRSQVCRLESGKSITLSSMMRAFRASRNFNLFESLSDCSMFSDSSAGSWFGSAVLNCDPPTIW